jgi:hypothetical protein
MLLPCRPLRRDTPQDLQPLDGDLDGQPSTGSGRQFPRAGTSTRADRPHQHTRRAPRRHRGGPRRRLPRRAHQRAADRPRGPGCGSRIRARPVCAPPSQSRLG